MRKPIGRLALVLLLVLGWCGYRIGWGHPFTINQLANRQALQLALADPELFTQIGAVDGTFLDFHSDELSEVGVEARDEDYAMLERFIAEIGQFDRAALQGQDQITYDLMLEFWQAQLAGKPFGWMSSEGIYPISQMSGAQVQLGAFLQDVHPVDNPKTARNYVRRLVAAGRKLDQITAEMKRQADAGVVLPPALLERSIEVVAASIEGEPAANVLVTGFVGKLKDVDALDEAARAELQQAAVAAVREQVYPAYARMLAALEAERGRSAGVAAGVGRLPDGAAFYATQLRQYTTTDYTAERIHRMGLDEVARISAEADALLAGQGLTEGTVAERLAALGADPRFLLPNDDAGREQMLQRYREILREIGARMPEFFSHPPRGELAVQRMPLASEKGASGAYYLPGSLDGKRPGTFYASLRDLRERPTWGMKTLAYHEGIPGHHFQIAAAMELEGLPLLRQQPLFSAYAEGWGLYAERLAAEIGMYQGDPFGDLGRLQAELFRAARLVVDTGMHAKGWSREDAIRYMVDTTGRKEADVTSEVERYMSMPGQACAYKVGQLKILELRERAKQKLGERFDLKRFHDVVLANGTVPLTLLERSVDEWIAAGG